MLVLNRKTNNGIRIGKDGEIYIVVVEIRGDCVRLGVEAPKEVPVHREEVAKAILKSNAKNGFIPPDERSGLFGQREPGKGRLRTAIGNVHDHLAARHTTLVNTAADSEVGSTACFKAVAQAALLSEVLVLIEGAMRATESMA